MTEHQRKSLDEQIAAHAARNKDLASTISNYGISLDKERLADINFWSPDETTANKLEEALSRNEFANVRLSAGPTKWAVTAQLKAPVTTLISAEFTELLVLLADKYGSVYDGWGTALVELAPPRDRNEPQ